MQPVIKILGEKKFRSRVIKETAYGVVNDYGEQENVMILQRVNNCLMIEWSVGNDLDYAEISITTVGKVVTDYDGVFILPKEVVQLLNDCGFNTKEVEREVAKCQKKKTRT